MALSFKSFLESDAEHAKELAKTGFWGKAAAGVIFLAKDTGRLLLAHRSGDVEQPNTWGTWGGAIDQGETPAEAAKREAAEEAGYAGELKLKPLWTFKHPSGFQYHNFLAVVPSEFTPRLTWETQGYSWVEPGKWPKPLHFGMEKLLANAGDKLTA